MDRYDRGFIPNHSDPGGPLRLRSAAARRAVELRPARRGAASAGGANATRSRHSTLIVARSRPRWTALMRDKLGLVTTRAAIDVGWSASCSALLNDTAPTTRASSARWRHQRRLWQARGHRGRSRSFSPLQLTNEVDNAAARRPGSIALHAAPPPRKFRRRLSARDAHAARSIRSTCCATGWRRRRSSHAQAGDFALIDELRAAARHAVRRAPGGGAVRGSRSRRSGAEEIEVSCSSLTLVSNHRRLRFPAIASYGATSRNSRLAAFSRLCRKRPFIFEQQDRAAFRIVQAQCANVLRPAPR